MIAIRHHVARRRVVLMYGFDNTDQCHDHIYFTFSSIFKYCHCVIVKVKLKEHPTRNISADYYSKNNIINYSSSLNVMEKSIFREK